MRMVMLHDYQTWKAGESAVLTPNIAWWLISIGWARQATPDDPCPTPKPKPKVAETVANVRVKAATVATK